MASFCAPGDEVWANFTDTTGFGNDAILLPESGPYTKATCPCQPVEGGGGSSGGSSGGGSSGGSSTAPDELVCLDVVTRVECNADGGLDVETHKIVLLKSEIDPPAGCKPFAGGTP